MYYTVTSVHVVAYGQRLSRQVVLLADECVVVEHVELLACAHLLSTDQTGEAVQVEYLVPSFAHQVRRIDALRAAAALCSVTPGKQKIFFFNFI